MVGGVEVGDVEVDVLNAVIAGRAKLYRESDLSKRFRHLARYHTLEGRIGGCEVFYPKARLL